MTELLLFDMSQVFSSVQFIWVLGGVIFVILCLMILRQRRQGIQLRSELAELDKMLENNVEYEFILKAMKIAIWRYDAQTQSFQYEHDFREGMDSYVPAKNENFKQTLTAISPGDIDHVNKAFMDICSGVTDFYHQEYQVINNLTGKSYWEESYGTIAARDEEGLPSRIVGTSMRIDAQKEMEAALIAARNKAEESDRLKTAFLANMGHEIRTPLNAIVGFADLLPMIEDSEERNQIIAEIQKNNYKLLNIIDGLVSMSKVESEAKSLIKSQTDIVPLLRQIADSFAPMVDPQAVTLATSFPISELMMDTDTNKLKEIITNLMQNAVKFTSQGSITLGFDLPQGDRLCLWVLDTGKGIAEADQQRIFERFVKVDEYIPGTGLGLSVAKSHAESLGGSIGVDSILGEGSRFWVEVPIG